MIILLRKKSVRLICLLLAAIGLVYGGYGLAADRASATAQPVAQAVLAEAEPPLVESTPPIAEPPASSALPVVTESVVQEMPIAMPPVAEDGIVAMRLERNQNRDRQLEMLQTLVNNPATSAVAKTDAEQQIMQSTNESTLELQAETLLKTKGYDQAVVMIHFDQATVYTQGALSDEDYAKIGDLVHRSTNFALQQIIIVPK